jgi:DNA-directed RNA polymerase subunit RPC12/RpoP
MRKVLHGTPAKRGGTYLYMCGNCYRKVRLRVRYDVRQLHEGAVVCPRCEGTDIVNLTAQREGLLRLQAHHTHAFITSEEADAICDLFQFERRPAERRQANTSDPKGLKNSTRGLNTVTGHSIYLLAAYLADKMPDAPGQDRSYQSALGRGFMAQDAWRYIAASLTQFGA